MTPIIDRSDTTTTITRDAKADLKRICGTGRKQKDVVGRLIAWLAAKPEAERDAFLRGDGIATGAKGATK